MNITKLYLLNTPLESDYKHTLYFDKPKTQFDYFYSKRVFNFTDFSYQRKESKIRIPKQFDEINGKVNYVMYQNTAYTDKWFYAFITDIQYVSDGVTDVYISTDVMQSWLFDYELKSCFVEREHTKDDRPGKNTVPEGLETGEYICNNVIHDNSMDNTCFIVGCTIDINSSNGADSGLRLYGGVVNGWYYYYFETKEQIQNVLSNIAELRTNDAIVSIFVMPTLYVHKGENDKVTESWEIPKYTTWNSIYKPTHLDNYTPFNNKLFSYPYSYLLIDNNCGATATYKYELFNDLSDKEKCPFIIYGTITPGGSIRLMPMYYNGVPGENNHYGLPGGKFPICGWQSDYYTNWLTQNSLNLQVQTEAIRLAGSRELMNIGADIGHNAIDIAGGAGSAITNSLLLNPNGAISGVTNAGHGAISLANNVGNAAIANKQIANQIQSITAQKEIHAFQSPTTGGSTNCGDILYTTGNIKFSAYHMSVKEEYARIIDNYFSMYGYQTNRVKIPNVNHRSRYWYTKTVGCEIDGPLPNTDLQGIKKIYDCGITFWKNPNEIGKYTDDNNDLIANLIV